MVTRSEAVSLQNIGVVSFGRAATRDVLDVSLAIKAVEAGASHYRITSASGMNRPLIMKRGTGMIIAGQNGRVLAKRARELIALVCAVTARSDGCITDCRSGNRVLPACYGGAETGQEIAIISALP
ncbi:YdgH/BhsA/McbA-like domain containing protein [Klebsiella aerogenes]|uniref:YdgH/BhsA/McbA-like domain containing protein n=1 Tax=Klebsiella aerogenes TaxID=548 RepID=UPI001D0D9C24|nr:YdgH/BhsA/McbA-like domain containing protein [Klebsiella aerogenes]